MIDIDRRIHARNETSGHVIVRYNRASKWFWETLGEPPTARTQLNVGDAAELAADWERQQAGSVNFHLPGGSVFDKLVTKNLSG